MKNISLDEIEKLIEIILLRHLTHKLDKIMEDQTVLNAAIAQLDTDVKALIASQVPPTPVDLQPQVDAVNAIDAEVKAATPATP